jgi:GH15 family glucan-1,4-alpha-glucosidase
MLGLRMGSKQKCAAEVHPFTGVPVSVSPLIWSHAEFVIAVCEYLEKYRELSSLAGNN